MRSPGGRILLAMALATGVGLAAATQGSASGSTTISIIASPNPVPAQRFMTIRATGSAPNPVDVYGNYKQAGQPCAATPGADTGTAVIYDTGLSGSYTAPPYYSPWFPVGDYRICAWAESAGADESSPPLAQASLIVHSVLPKASLGLSAPGKVPTDGYGHVSVRWSANGPIEVWLDLRPAGQGPCASRRSGEPRHAEDLLSGGTSGDPTSYVSVGPERTPGTDSQSGTLRALAAPPRPGTYRLCAYAQEPVPVGATNQEPAATAPVAPVRSATLVEAAPLTFTGRTAIGERVRFVDTNGIVHPFTTRVVYVCDDSYHSHFREPLASGPVSARVRHGKFSFFRGEIKGHVAGTRAWGTVGPISYTSGPYLCTARRVSWSARARGGD